jgi:hypothetical protein
VLCRRLRAGLGGGAEHCLNQRAEFTSPDWIGIIVLGQTRWPPACPPALRIEYARCGVHFGVTEFHDFIFVAGHERLS